MYQPGNRFKAWPARLRPLAVVLALFLLSTVPLVHDRSPADLMPAFPDDLDQASLLAAIDRSIAYLEKLPAERVVGEAPRRFTAKEILDSLREFAALERRGDCRKCWMKKIAARFEFIPSSGEAELNPVLFTGYYQPVIAASLVPTAEYKYPIYGKPADLVVAEQVTLVPLLKTRRLVGRVEGENFVPYYSRREIDQAGALRGHGYEIAWAKDPVDLFFLHVQGSGILQLADGRRFHVGYAAGNGRPYRSIGRLLIDRGKLAQSEMSMQRLRRYLTEHPAQRDEIMDFNESYVFFRFLPDGPLGSLAVSLTAGRSIATDASLFPKGALAFVITQKPILDSRGKLAGWRPFARFVLNQDTGGAIRGARRVDLYFGSGDDAGAGAGFMNRRGSLYFVALKKIPVAAEK